MEDSLPLAAAYQRLLGELSRRLGADHAELQLHADSPAPAPAAVHAGVDGADAAGWRWLDIPINEGAREVGRLRMAFAAAAPLPGPADRAMAQALVDLAPLLAQERQQVALSPLREAGRRILAVTEEELQRIILDIHDGPVQKLFVVSSQLALLQGQIADSPEPQRREIETAIGRAAELVQSALQEIKNTLSTFRPAEFQRRSLESVLQGLAFQHEYATGNQVDLYIAGPIPPVSMPVKIALYRVLQEALSNSYRHAGVDSQEVFLTSQDRWVILEVTDDGIGFTPPPMEGPGATEREEHIGLRGMRERVHLAGGSLRVISQPGHGTRVIVQVPSDA